ncbi:PucR family transcriptional regulator [Kitasatospora sp. NPDC051853]|uniref:PucR family transcriptional regulator n=1 Tax=Kitasatospora sp. NPDC051853 TaxID=3364058 RepID=UPI0037B41A47
MTQAVPDSHLDEYTRVLAQVAATGRRLSRDELEACRLAGERAAEAGHGLRAAVRAHLAATRTAWPAGALERTATVLAAVEQAVDAFAEGHERAQRLAVRQEETARREFIDDLLYGRSDLGRLAERAKHFGLLLSHAHAVAVAQGPVAYSDGDPVTRQVDSALIHRFGDRRILLTTKEGRLVCVAPGDEDDVLAYFVRQTCTATGSALVAIGRPHPGAGGVVHSYEEALGALDLAGRMDLPGPVLRVSDLLVFPVLTRDREALADLVAGVLGPLRRARGGPAVLVETLSAYFDSGCVSAEAARRLRLSVRALTYRLDRVRQLTGSDPADPVHRYTLQTAVIGARLLDWPASGL